MKKRLHLFEGYGVELEYMIVDKLTLNIRPVADLILKNEAGEVQGEIDRGMTAWSNELVAHVIEVKANGPQSDLVALKNHFLEDIRSINRQLDSFGCTLLPGAAHPWMKPALETKLWEHENQEIYYAYDRIFNCKGHGWSNLQSTHINFPFYDDEEFARLHTAIRFMMPMIPALTASSPILNGKFTGYIDKRLYYYEKNQSKLPILTGKLIPEKLFTRHQYQKHIYDRIATAIAPFDNDGILEPVWLNSRGAIARFDRGAIEIRIIDIQECVSADLAIVVFLTQLVKLLVSGKLVSFRIQESFETNDLYDMFKMNVKHGSKAELVNPAYLKAWGISGVISGRDFWSQLIQKVKELAPEAMMPWDETLKGINAKGTLSERILAAVGEDYSHDNLKEVYKSLSDCLQNDELFGV